MHLRRVRNFFSSLEVCCAEKFLRQTFLASSFRSPNPSRRSVTPQRLFAASSVSSPKIPDSSTPASPAPMARSFGRWQSIPPEKLLKPATRFPSSTDSPTRDTAAPSLVRFCAARTAKYTTACNSPQRKTTASRSLARTIPARTRLLRSCSTAAQARAFRPDSLWPPAGKIIRRSSSHTTFACKKAGWRSGSSAWKSP